MIYLLGPVVALQLVLGQVLWKAAIDRYGFTLTREYVLSHQFVTFVLSPLVIGGLVVYALATLSYFGMLAKFPYSSVQAVIVSASLILTYLASAAIFHERHSPINLLGFAVLVVGVVLATRGG
jgi:drug/metabolite transporter (DMT)-like permease